jgi:hypothetical protein
MSEFLRIAKEEDYNYERYIPRLFNEFFSRIPFDNEDFNYFMKKNRIVNVLNIDGNYISYGIHLQDINGYIVLQFKCINGFITDTRVDYFVIDPFGKNSITVLNRYAYKLDRGIVRAIFDDMAKLMAEFKFDYPEYNRINDKEFFDLAQDYFYLATKDAIYNPQEEY